MRVSEIRAIPQDVKTEIISLCRASDRNITKYYAYFDVLSSGELVKITIATHRHPKTQKLMMKQVAVRDLDGNAVARDMYFTYIVGYMTDWTFEKNGSHQAKGRWVKIEDKYFNPGARFVCIDKLADTSFKYAGYKEYYAVTGMDVMTYLRIWREHPKVEILAKAGLGFLCNSKLIIGKCEKDKKFIEFLRQNLDYLKPYEHQLSVMPIVNAYKWCMSIDKAEIITHMSGYIKNVIPRCEYEKFAGYILRNNTSSSNYADYVHACLALGIDMTDTKNKYPKDFRYWHDMRADQYYMVKHKVEAERLLDIADKYKGLQYEDEYCVFIAKSHRDLVDEGNALQHCVGKMNYDSRMIKEESLIFFVRRRENPSQPYVTIEYSLRTKKVLQCYREQNFKPPQDVLNFVYDKWQKHAIKALKKIV